MDTQGRWKLLVGSLLTAASLAAARPASAGWADMFTGGGVCKLQFGTLNGTYGVACGPNQDAATCTPNDAGAPGPQTTCYLLGGVPRYNDENFCKAVQCAYARCIRKGDCSTKNGRTASARDFAQGSGQNSADPSASGDQSSGGQDQDGQGVQTPSWCPKLDKDGNYVPGT